MTGTDDGVPEPSPQTSQTPPRWYARRGTAVRAFRSSWLFTADPIPGGEAWEQSKVDRSRIPKAPLAHLCEIVWQFSNGFDRLAFWVPIWLLGFLPDKRWTRWIDGPTRHLFVRPTRRWTFYWVTTIAVIWLIGVL